MMLRNFFYCCVIIVLANRAPCLASQPETEFTEQAAATVTQQPSLQDSLAAHLLKRRAATGDEAETENELTSELCQLRGDVKKLTDLVHTFEKQVRLLEGELELVRNAAEANKALDADDKELYELEKGQLLEEIMNLKRRALEAEEETRKEKALREAQILAEKDTILVAVEMGIAQAKELFATREAELLAELARRNEELRLTREAQLLAENRLKELQSELKTDRERMQRTEQTLSELQNDRVADRERIRKLEDGASHANQTAIQPLTDGFVVVEHPSSPNLLVSTSSQKKRGCCYCMLRRFRQPAVNQGL